MQDEATVFADPNDRASQESDMALELRNRDRERKLIKKIDETIARIGRERVRLLRELRRRDRFSSGSEARPTATLVHRLQDARRAARAPGRQVRRTIRSASRFPEGCCLHGQAYPSFVVGFRTFTFTTWPSFR